MALLTTDWFENATREVALFFTSGAPRDPAHISSSRHIKATATRKPLTRHTLLGLMES